MSAKATLDYIVRTVFGHRQHFSWDGSDQGLADYRKRARRFARKKRSALASARTRRHHGSCCRDRGGQPIFDAAQFRPAAARPDRCLADAPAAVFWPVLLHAWTHCDDTHLCVPELLKVIQRHMDVSEHPAEYWDAEAFGFYEALPAEVAVYRGCSRPRVNGISWTIDRSVAEEFARGHRFIPVPDPVTATGMIARDLILAIFVERKERELLIDPRAIEELTIWSVP